MKDLELLVTLWPSIPHFKRFATDYRISAIRLNSAMIHNYELEKEFEIADSVKDHVPLYFDVKGMQLRIDKVIPNNDHLEVILNHKIECETPSMVLFKGAKDYALLKEIKEGDHLIFEGGPKYMVHDGESIHIRDPDLKVSRPTFTDKEVEKIKTALDAGYTKFCLSYVENQQDVDDLRKYVGPDAEVILKIENKKGLEFVANDFKKDKNTYLMAACGDLYVEVDKPHDMMEALKLIIKKDPEAYAGSRMLLSIMNEPVPELSDMLQLSWLYDAGYRRLMLCDDICLKEEWLATAINVFEAFRQSYTKDLVKIKEEVKEEKKKTFFDNIKSKLKITS